MKENFCVLIPAYKPCKKLVSLLIDIREKTNCPIIVIDDGSGEEYSKIFAEARKISECHVIGYERNGGKGHAMKHGFRLYSEIYASTDLWGIVTADADGQHLVKDIIRVGNELKDAQNDLILGVRRFKKDVPLRSKMGNNITIFAYRIASGQKVSDTQTGLRGIPAKHINAMAELEGERYEYEMNMLLALKELELGIKEIGIETVYIDNNSGSHFDTFKDSYRIYKLIFQKAYGIKYTLSSFLAWGVDYLLYIIFLALSGFGGVMGIFANPKNAQIPARAISSVINFFTNKNFVFNNKDKSLKGVVLQGIGYFGLVVLSLFLVARPVNGLLIDWGINKYFSVLIANLVQFAFNYIIQKYIIFRISFFKKKD